MADSRQNSTLSSEIERMTKLSNEEIFSELHRVGVDINEDVFRKVAGKHHSINSVARCWEANRGTSPALLTAATVALWDRLCTELFCWEDLASLMRKGIEDVRSGNHMQAIDKWLNAWRSLRKFAVEQSVRDISVFDVQVMENVLPMDLFSWVQDVEMELTNQVDEFPQLAQALLDYTTSFRDTFPSSATPILLNMRSAQSVALFVLGDTEAADVICEELCNAYPDDAWTFIDWGDEYSPRYHRNPALVDVQKARQIYERGLATATEDVETLRERIAALATEA
ncbi:hypothetical protein [Alicyclobacillus fastidiosus]|uniref:Uncharacterized protein n=1 Tax=Alicyclobacillus fastidiosus TaxID=392011 RepID=A0ABV5A977_9BACL|nr:hypothetical protein [Alicyclobacillus fastidiosus]WEH10763.1 hypothetical protein PYS47_05940 [Alicyclobacillus fastidiosus]